MKEKLRFLGLDVHAETIAVAIAEADGEVRSLGTIPNRLESIRKLIKKLGPTEKLRACYEAGPTGYVLYWQLAELGVKCDVVAPTLVPVKAGDRVKTDRRDAEKLARSHRSGAEPYQHNRRGYGSLSDAWGADLRRSSEACGTWCAI
jgi:transposase